MVLSFIRIRVLKNFVDIKSGDFGGYIETDCNLSHEGMCWIYGGALVMDNARVYSNAQV